MDVTNKKRATYSILIIFIIAISGLLGLIFYPEYPQGSEPESPQGVDPESPLGIAYASADEKAQAADKNLVAANTRFAIKMLKELINEDADKNIFISPLSISTALVMTYNGAEGSTSEAMAETLEFTGITMEELNQNYSNLIESLEKVDADVQLSIANSVWTREEFAPLVKQSFTQQLEKYYRSELYTRDFSDPKTVEEINDWISTETNDKIDKMIEGIDPQIVMFLINAIYFKGNWTTPFEEYNTHTDDFHLSDGSNVQVSYMSNNDDYRYYNGSNYQALRLPYGRDKIAMYVLLPNEDVDIDSFIQTLNHDKLDEDFDGYSTKKVIIKLPKFKLEYGVKRLNDALKNLGMGVAFNMDAANFSGIASLEPPYNLYIGFVDHKAFVEINEKGTEAAAGTVVGMELSAIMPQQSFIVDRPFVFVIRDDRSGSILFMGKIVNPLETKSP
jgi:serine protease inhibitor